MPLEEQPQHMSVQNMVMIASSVRLPRCHCSASGHRLDPHHASHPAPRHAIPSPLPFLSARTQPLPVCSATRTPLSSRLSLSPRPQAHCPLSDATRGLIGAAALARMKPTSYLINTAPGAVVDEAALCAALRAGALAGAALDVQARVPPLRRRRRRRYASARARARKEGEK